jgi:hypothetical protein
LAENLKDYSDEQLITEVAEYNPELWNMWQFKNWHTGTPKIPKGCHT